MASDAGGRSRRVMLGMVMSLISVPAILVPIEALHYYLRNRSNGTIVSSGVSREYVLFVPTSYDDATPTPLVFSLHGAGMWGAAQRETSRWNDVAEREGLIVVYPSGGESDGEGPRGWQVDGSIGLMNHVRFISDLIDTLEAEYNVDPARIYVDGFSDGGGMAFALSCTLSDRIAAVGMVAAAQTLPWEWCPDDGPMPMIAFHGTADRIVPYDGGFSFVSARGHRPFPSVPGRVARWAQRNRCAATPRDSMVVPDVSRRTYLECADRAAVVLYTIEGGGHTWPGGGPLPEWLTGSTSRSVDATGLNWAFFREHPRRGTRPAIGSPSPGPPP